VQGACYTVSCGYYNCIPVAQVLHVRVTKPSPCIEARLAPLHPWNIRLIFHDLTPTQMQFPCKTCNQTQIWTWTETFTKYTFTCMQLLIFIPVPFTRPKGLLSMLFLNAFMFPTCKLATMPKGSTVYQLNLAKLIFGDSLKICNWRKFNLTIC